MLESLSYYLLSIETNVWEWNPNKWFEMNTKLKNIYIKLFIFSFILGNNYVNKSYQAKNFPLLSKSFILFLSKYWIRLGGCQYFLWMILSVLFWIRWSIMGSSHILVEFEVINQFESFSFENEEIFHKIIIQLIDFLTISDDKVFCK